MKTMKQILRETLEELKTRHELGRRNLFLCCIAGSVMDRKIVGSDRQRFEDYLVKNIDNIILPGWGGVNYSKAVEEHGNIVNGCAIWENDEFEERKAWLVNQIAKLSIN